MTTVRRWTGREAKLLREALRLSVRDFAARLGIGLRTVNKGEARQSDITPLPHMQEVLDTALARASDDAKARFTAMACITAPEHETTQSSGPPGRGAVLPVVVNGRLMFVPFDADTVASGGLNALLDERRLLMRRRIQRLLSVNGHRSEVLPLMPRPTSGRRSPRSPSVWGRRTSTWTD